MRSKLFSSIYVIFKSIYSILCTCMYMRDCMPTSVELPVEARREGAARALTHRAIITLAMLGLLQTLVTSYLVITLYELFCNQDHQIAFIT